MPTQPTALLCASGSTQRWIDGVRCGLFLIHAPHGQTSLLYMWNKYLYSVLGKVEVRMTVSVTVCVM